MRCCFVAVQFSPIGVPLMYYFLLHRLKNLIDLGQKRPSFELGEEAGLQAALVERERQEEENEDLQGVSFLYGSFEPMFWWFEILDTIRKLVLTGGLIFLGPGTTEQIAISMIICLAALRIFSGFKPFIKESHDQFSEVAQWQVR